MVLLTCSIEVYDCDRYNGEVWEACAGHRPIIIYYVVLEKQKKVTRQMEVKGSQKISAPQPQVFQALLNPEVLKNSIPGCEKAELVDFPDGQQLKLKVSPSVPGLKGPYNVFMRTRDVVPPSHVVLIAEPKSNVGSVVATCVVDLVTEADVTVLNYNANAVLEGKIAHTPEIVLKGTIKLALDQFFKNFEKQVAMITA
jgi:uncharacterized protein